MELKGTTCTWICTRLADAEHVPGEGPIASPRRIYRELGLRATRTSVLTDPC
jgi:hypothetical protein